MTHTRTTGAQRLAAAGAKEWFENRVTKRLASDGDAEDGIAPLRESYDELRAG
jgi:hypothetical protein